MQLLKSIVFGGLIAATAGFVATSDAIAQTASAGAPSRLRIGYQKSSGILIILKERGTLEKLLAPLGVTVEWTEFSSGLPLLEGLNVGQIDLSADVAEPVPLFAQAAGAKLTYLVQETPSPEGQAIVVPVDSPVRTVADLKGRKVAVSRGAGVHYLLLKSADKAGLTFRDIDAAYLQPADARAAFEKGAVDAWAIWEPHLARLQNDRSVRIIADGSYAGVSYRRFYLTSTPYAKQRPDVLNIVVAELQKVGQWIKQNPDEAAAFHGPLVGLKPELAAIANSRRSYDVQLVDDKALDEQQNIADAFTAEKVLPRKINLRDNDVWKGGQ